jgi:lysophospholipase L1-like esterase
VIVLSLRRFAAVALFAAFAAGHAYADDAPPFRADCKAKATAALLDGSGLTHVAARIARNEPVTIVAFGSSSTVGVGASSVLATYPARLEAELKALFPGVAIRVVNRGISGEDVTEMLKRFDHDIIETKPDLVVWQLGTNAILRDNGIAPEQPLIMEGLARFKRSNADLVLMDPQYAPKVMRDPDAVPMVEMIEKIAHEQHIPLFHRHDMMRHWRDDLQMPYENFLSKDLLHMNDFSYGCTARYLAAAIADDVHRMRASLEGVQASVPPPATPLADKR